jgi:hypothetical protein
MQGYFTFDFTLLRVQNNSVVLGLKLFLLITYTIKSCNTLIHFNPLITPHSNWFLSSNICYIKFLINCQANQASNLFFFSFPTVHALLPRPRRRGWEACNFLAYSQGSSTPSGTPGRRVLGACNFLASRFPPPMPPVVFLTSPTHNITFIHHSQHTI